MVWKKHKHTHTQTGDEAICLLGLAEAWGSGAAGHPDTQPACGAVSQVSVGDWGGSVGANMSGSTLGHLTAAPSSLRSGLQRIDRGEILSILH